MKTRTLLTAFAGTAALAMTVIASMSAVTACTSGENAGMEIIRTEYADSTDMLHYILDVEMPLPERGEAAKMISDTLMCLLEKDMMGIAAYDEALFKEFGGDRSDRDAYLAYLRDESFAQLDRISQAEKKDALEYGCEPHPWCCEIGLRMISQGESHIVFNLTEYLNFGGAHGGTSGKGALTFSKKSGRLVTEMIDRSRLEELQPLLISGLKSYFDEYKEQLGSDYELFDLLFVSDGIIPLPQMTPYPSEEGMTFIYREYEIAPYAAGMPEFTVPYGQIRPYLSAEANELI